MLSHFGVGIILPHGSYLPVVWWSQGGNGYGWHFYVTIPVSLKYFHAPWGFPPSQPFPQVNVPQQLKTSRADSFICYFWPLPIQILSLIDYTAANAQHEPQVLWSLTYLID